MYNNSNIKNRKRLHTDNDKSYIIINKYPQSNSNRNNDKDKDNNL